MCTIISCGDKIVYSIGEALVIHKDGKFETISLPKPLDTEQKNLISNELNATIISLCTSANREFIALSTEHKQIVVFNNSMDVMKNIISKRIPSKLCFTPDNKSLVVADKTGDVYLYNLNQEEASPLLILGHMSVVLDVIISDCGRYILTCDRDEKIRVSRFPNAYNIESYCLGHDEFVVSLRLHQNLLISASGDGTIKLWSYLIGKELAMINTNEYIPEKTIRDFCEKMSVECVNVSALPITDMQAKMFSNYFCIVASLFNYEKILMFFIDSNSFQLISHEQLQIGSSFSFLLEEKLLVLTSSNLTIFEIEERKFVKRNVLNLPQPHVNTSFTNDHNVSLFYKKKFDNVGDYLERKKARIETK